MGEQEQIIGNTVLVRRYQYQRITGAVKGRTPQWWNGIAGQLDAAVSEGQDHNG